MLDGLGVAAGPERIEVVIELDRKRVEARETVANVRRDVTGVRSASQVVGRRRQT